MALIIKLFSLIITYFCINLLGVRAEDEDCQQWQQMCLNANSAHSANFRCINTTVYYFDYETQSWDRARQLCSQKFYGSYTADLVELSSKHIEDVNTTIKDILHEHFTGSPYMEIFANGVCCKRKIQTNEHRRECQWLSDEEKIESPFDDNRPEADTKCNILLLRAYTMNNELNYLPKYVDKSDGTYLPYLCTYRAPVNCMPIVIATPNPTTSTTTTRVTQSLSTEDRPITVSTTSTQSTTSSHQTETMCNAKGEYNGSYDIDWSPVAPNHWSNNSCPLGHQTEGASAQWYCMNNSKFDTKGPVINCSAEWISDLSDRVDNLTSAHQVVNESYYLLNKLTESELKYYGDLSTIASIVERLQQNIDYFDKSLVLLTNYTSNIVGIYSQLIDQIAAWNNSQTQQKTEIASSILRHIQYSGIALGCLRNGDNNQSDAEHQLITENNIAINTYSMSEYKTEIRFVDEDMSTITIPVGINASHSDSNVNCDSQVAMAAAFNKLGHYMSAYLGSALLINSDVLGFSFTNSTESVKLDKSLKVRVSLNHANKLQFGDKMRCVYWDFNASEWSSNGCYLEVGNSSRTQTVCVCDHLTNFAALMDVSGRETDTTVKSILTIVCCCLSIVGLLLTLLFLTTVRVLRNRRSTITCNLCVCLLVTNLLVAFGMNKTDYNILCQTISGLLLYSLLSSFSWMLMEGYHLYQMIVLVFSNIGRLTIVWLYTIGYGAPFIVFITACLSIGFKQLQGDYFCWISSSKSPYRVWALAAPATIVVLANCMIMFLALKAAFSAKVKKTEPSSVSVTSSGLTSNSFVNKMGPTLTTKISWMKGYVSLVVLLGITWISYLFYIHEFGSFFAYLFIVLNGLQGVFIFTFQILLNEKARNVIENQWNRRRQSVFTSLTKTSSVRIFSTSVRSKSIDTSSSSKDSNHIGLTNRIAANQRNKSIVDSILT